MTGSGSDRCARGLKAALRRCGYGLLLWCSQMAAADARGLDSTPSPMPAQRVIERLESAWPDNVSPLAQVGDGVGIDFGLPQAGSLHLLLSARNDEAREVPQWTFSETAEDVVQEPRWWSLGAALETIDLLPTPLGTRQRQESDDQTRRKAFAQQLRFDLDRLFGWRGDTVMTLQRSSWIDRDSGRRSAAVMQLHLKWRF